MAGAANFVALKGISPGKGTKPVLEILNQICDFAKGDRPLSSEIENVSDLINSNELAQHVSKYLRLE